MTVIYKNDFKVRIPSGFSAQIIFDMLGEKEFMSFYEKYHHIKEVRKMARKIKSLPSITEIIDKDMKDAFRKNPKYYGKVIDKIII